VFFRTYEDLSQTPPLSRAASVQLEEIKKSFHDRLEPEQTSSVDPDRTIVLASRNSQLALVQTSHVSAMLTSHFGKYSPAFIKADVASSSTAISASAGTPPESPKPSYSEDVVKQYQSNMDELAIRSPIAFPFTSMSTGGDQNSASPLYVIGGEGRAIWTKELEVALAGGAVDAIVHCLKDVPTTLPDGMMLGAILEREDPRDALIIKKGLPYTTLDELPPGSVIGTSSIRRVAQLRRRYPDLVFSDVRGNLITRLSKLDNPTGPYTALVLAAAGLIRLNLSSRISAFLSAPVMMHAVGQGSLTIEVRKPPAGATPENNRDARILAMVQAIGDWRSTWRQEAERSLLRELEGGCSIPIGVECYFDDHDEIEGLRNEQAAVRQVDIENGLRDTLSAPVVRNGHTIPASQLQSGNTSEPEDERPSPLKRLATEQNIRGATEKIAASQAQNVSSKVDAPMPVVSASSDGSTPVILVPEDRATPPSNAVYLTLTAMVVSLDGARHSEYTLRKAVGSVEEARQLGIEVAHELAHKRGARLILDEVERHRKLAEEADDRRRMLEKQKRIRAAAAAHAIDKNGGGESDEDRENRRQLEELLRKSVKVPATVQSSALGAKALGGTIGGPEIDRRGVPRDDGQAKAWEV
jgi:hydroxymethylbilane synthase